MTSHRLCDTCVSLRTTLWSLGISLCINFCCHLCRTLVSCMRSPFRCSYSAVQHLTPKQRTTETQEADSYSDLSPWQTVCPSFTDVYINTIGSRLLAFLLSRDSKQAPSSVWTSHRLSARYRVMSCRSGSDECGNVSASAVFRITAKRCTLVWNALAYVCELLCFPFLRS